MVTVIKAGQKPREVAYSRRNVSSAQNNENEQLKQELLSKGYVQEGDKLVKKQNVEFRDVKGSGGETREVVVSEAKLDNGNVVYVKDYRKSGKDMVQSKTTYYKEGVAVSSSGVRYEGSERVEVIKTDITTGERQVIDVKEEKRQAELSKQTPVVGTEKRGSSYYDTETGYKLTESEVRQRKEAYETAVEENKDKVEFERLSSPRQYDVPTDYLTSTTIRQRYGEKDLTDPTFKAQLLQGSSSLRKMEEQIEIETEGTKQKKVETEQKFQDWRFRSGDYFGGIDTELRMRNLEAERSAYDKQIKDLEEEGGFVATTKRSLLKIKGRPDEWRKPTTIQLGLAREEYDVQESINDYQLELQKRVDKGTMTKAQAQRLLDKAVDKGEDYLEERELELRPQQQIETESYDFQESVALEKGGLSLATLNISQGLRNVQPGRLFISERATGTLGKIRDYSLGDFGTDVSTGFENLGDIQAERNIEIEKRLEGKTDFASVQERALSRGFVDLSYGISGGAEFVTRKPLTAGAIVGASALTGGLVGAGVSAGGATAVGTVAVSSVAGLGFGTLYGLQVSQGIKIREGKERSKYIGAEATKVGLGLIGFRAGYKYTTTPKVTSPIKYKYTETKIIGGKDVKSNIPFSQRQTGKLELSYTQKLPFKKPQQVKIVQEGGKFVRTVKQSGKRYVFTQQDGKAQLQTFKGRKLIKTKKARPLTFDSDTQINLLAEKELTQPIKRFTQGGKEGVEQFKASEQLFNVQGKNYYGQLKSTRTVTKIDTIGKGTKITDVIDFKKIGKTYGTQAVRLGKEQFRIGIDVGKTSKFTSGITTKTGRPSLYSVGDRIATTGTTTKTIIPQVRTQIIQTEITTGKLFTGKAPGLSRTEQSIINLWGKETQNIKRLFTPGKVTKAETVLVPGYDTSNFAGTISRPDTTVITQPATISRTVTVAKPVLTTKFTPSVLLPSTFAVGTQSGLTSLVTSTSITGLLLNTGTQPITTSLNRGLITSQPQTTAPSQVTGTTQTTAVSSPGTISVGIDNPFTPRTGRISKPIVRPPTLPPEDTPFIPPPIFPGFLPIFGFGSSVGRETKRRKRKEKFQRSFTARTLGIKTRKQAQSFFGKGIIIEEKGKTKKGKFNLLGIRI